MFSKTQAGYRLNPGAGGCAVGQGCRWYNGGNCPIVAMRVQPDACCDFWNKPDAPRGIGPHKAEYVVAPGHTEFLCDDCRFLNPDRRSCQIVQGPVRPQDVCDKWQPGAIWRPNAAAQQLPR